MTELLNQTGYFAEDFARSILEPIGSITKHEVINLMDPKLQERVARLSIWRSLILIIEQGVQSGSVFRRVQKDSGGVFQEVELWMNFDKPGTVGFLAGVYRSLSLAGQRAYQPEIIQEIDDIWRFGHAI